PVLLAPLTGKVADRFNSRTLIVTVALTQTAICLIMAASSTSWLLIALSVLLSTGLAFTHPVFAALPGVMGGREGVPKASTISQTIAMAGMVAAPSIGGFLTARTGTRVPLYLDAVTFALVAVGGLVIRTRLHSNRGAAASGTGPAAPGDSAPAPYRVL